MYVVYLCLRPSEWDEDLDQEEVKRADEATKDKDNAIKVLFELVLRADKLHSTCLYQNMATRTSMSN